MRSRKQVIAPARGNSSLRCAAANRGTRCGYLIPQDCDAQPQTGDRASERQLFLIAITSRKQGIATARATLQIWEENIITPELLPGMTLT